MKPGSQKVDGEISSRWGYDDPPNEAQGNDLSSDVGSIF